jgi:Tfp pilus assembly protein PilO
MKRAPNMKIVTAITVVACVGGIGACFYQYSALNDATARVDSIQKKSKSEKTLQAQALRTANQLKGCSDRLAHLEQSVPEFAYVPTLMKELENVGKQNGIEVLGVRPIQPKDKKEDKNKATDKKPYQELKIEVKGRGNYRSVAAFIKALKTFPKIVAVKSLTLTPKPETNAKAPSKLDVVVELKTYVFQPAESSSTKTAGNERTIKNG